MTSGEAAPDRDPAEQAAEAGPDIREVHPDRHDWHPSIAVIASSYLPRVKVAKVGHVTFGTSQWVPEMTHYKVDPPGVTFEQLKAGTAVAKEWAAFADRGNALHLRNHEPSPLVGDQESASVDPGIPPDDEGEIVEGRRGGLVPAAGRMTNLALRVLPGPDRERYREEFRSELYELARAGASRWQQFAYALRLLDRAWVLRAELRSPATREARP